MLTGYNKFVEIKVHTNRVKMSNFNRFSKNETFKKQYVSQVFRKYVNNSVRVWVYDHNELYKYNITSYFRLYRSKTESRTRN